MQLFIFSDNLKKSAEYLYRRDKKRFNKQILELAQMLATVSYLVGTRRWPLRVDGNPFAPTHRHHPLIDWMKLTDQNYFRALEYFEELDGVKLKKDGKHHGAAVNRHSDNIRAAREAMALIPMGKFTGWPNMAKNSKKDIDFTHLPVFEAYKKYLTAIRRKK